MKVWLRCDMCGEKKHGSVPGSPSMVRCAALRATTCLAPMTRESFASWWCSGRTPPGADISVEEAR